MNQPVIALPGGVMPAALRYAPLKSALGSDVDFHSKDLEVYAGDAPPPDYSVDLEVAALANVADSLGARRFHVVGYSGGGFVALAFAGAYPDRLLSLAVFEPARVPGDLSAAEANLDRDFRQAPPSGPPAPWMQNRPAGLAAMMDAFLAYHFDRNRLRNCHFPVFYGYGDMTGEMVELEAAHLAQLFPDIHVRRFHGVHHFLPPEQIYTPEHIQDLRDLWARAERESLVGSAAH